MSAFAFLKQIVLAVWKFKYITRSLHYVRIEINSVTDITWARSDLVDAVLLVPSWLLFGGEENLMF